MLKQKWLADEDLRCQHNVQDYPPYEEESSLQNAEHFTCRPTDEPTQQTHKTERVRSKKANRKIISSEEQAKMKRRQKAMRGRDLQTRNLSKFVLGTMNRVLALHQHIKRLTAAEMLAVRQFRKEQGRQESYKKLMLAGNIGKIVEEYLSSTQIVKSVLQSKRMEISNKIVIVRLLEKIRGICFSSKGWKQPQFIAYTYKPFFHMSRRRRTLRFDNRFLPLASPRASLPSLPFLSPQQPPTPLMRRLIQQILSKSEQHIDLKAKAFLSCNAFLEALDEGFHNLHGLEQLAQQPHCLAHFEPEPPTISQNPRPADISSQELHKTISRKHSSRFGKEKSQSCDLGDMMKRQWQLQRQLAKKCSRNELVSIGEGPRHIQNQDRSQEIQQLLRRKKELLMESRQPQRNHTEASKSVLPDKKEKKFYAQNDEGEAFELRPTSQIKTREEPPAIKLANVKVLPGQQLTTTMRKRPIVELPTRKTKRRKDVGDTCVLIEQLYENEGAPNQECLIEEACRTHAGVRIATKEKSITSALRLPAIR